jgi:hypothetical protein
MGRLIPLPRSRPQTRVGSSVDVLADGGGSDYQLLPIAALLFAFSVARVVHALLRHERFELEPTVALGCVVALPWLAWRLVRKTP